MDQNVGKEGKEKILLRREEKRNLTWEERNRALQAFVEGGKKKEKRGGEDCPMNLPLSQERRRKKETCSIGGRNAASSARRAEDREERGKVILFFNSLTMLGEREAKLDLPSLCLSIKEKRRPPCLA